MREIKERKAHPLSDGRVDYRADVIAGGTTVPWSCVCSPDEGHDHDTIHKMLSDRLEERGKIIEALHGLVGQKGRVGLIRYEITDCNIQIHGPAKFVLHVAWVEAPISGGSEHRREFYRVMENPVKCMTPDEILSQIGFMLASNGHTFAKAVRAAGEFAGK